MKGLAGLGMIGLCVDETYFTDMKGATHQILRRFAPQNDKFALDIG